MADFKVGPFTLWTADGDAPHANYYCRMHAGQKAAGLPIGAIYDLVSDANKVREFIAQYRAQVLPAEPKAAVKGRGASVPLDKTAHTVGAYKRFNDAVYAPYSMDSASLAADGWEADKRFPMPEIIDGRSHRRVVPCGSQAPVTGKVKGRAYGKR